MGPETAFVRLQKVHRAGSGGRSSLEADGRTAGQAAKWTGSLQYVDSLKFLIE